MILALWILLIVRYLGIFSYTLSTMFTENLKISFAVHKKLIGVGTLYKP